MQPFHIHKNCGCYREISEQISPATVTIFCQKKTIKSFFIFTSTEVYAVGGSIQVKGGLFYRYCVLNLLNNVFRNVDQNVYTSLPFLDLKKAFDTINHQILLCKLEMYALHVNAVELFANYSDDRY